MRLWDPAVIREVFNKLQGIRSFYNVGDPDIDRYQIGGDLTQVLTANRDLDKSALPQQSWESEHLAYTHGYGNVMAATNASDRGQPVFTNKDIPVVSESTGTKVTKPATYFGEGQTGYVVVDSKRTEIDYTDDAGNTKFNRVQGQGRHQDRIRTRRLRATGRVRAPLRRRQPADLVQRHRQVQGPHVPRHA